MIYPRHIALIPDGNRTRARENDYSKYVWHLQGFNRVAEIIQYLFSKTDVEVFTVWWLSTENLKKRSDEELEYLFELYKNIPENVENFLKSNKVNFAVIGSMEWLPSHLVDFVNKKNEEFDFGSKRTVVLALNYWGRDEIIRWIKNFQKENKDLKNLNENVLGQYMDLWKYPNIEMVVRTKWDIATRLSGFMLWRIGYAELFFSKNKCPEFDVERLEEALKRFDNISSNRNFGK